MKETLANNNARPDCGAYDFPRGWFMIGVSEDFAVDKPNSLSFFSENFVGFRNSVGGVTVLEAHCPHMGANMAFGGAVEGDCIRCPFHGWKFDADGKCVEIPGAERIPSKARVQSFPTCEQNGLVFMWRDPELQQPDYTIPYLDEWDRDDWVRWSPVNFTIKTHPREIIDNMGDKAHFEPVHGNRVVTFENTFDRHICTQTQTGFHETLSDDHGPIRSVATYHGPGYLITDIETHFSSKMLVAHTPVDAENVRVWYGSMVHAGESNPSDFVGVAAAYAEQGRVSFCQDVVLWENKKNVNRPIYSEADGDIFKVRKWYSQFYNPRAGKLSAAS